MNPSRSPNEHHIRDLQEEIRTKLEQAKALENIIASQEIKVDESDQLQGLYMIKLNRGIYILETNEHNCSEEKKSHINLKTETKGDYIREEIEDNAIIIISV